MPRPDTFAKFAAPPPVEKKSIFSYALRPKKTAAEEKPLKQSSTVTECNKENLQEVAEVAKNEENTTTKIEDKLEDTPNDEETAAGLPAEDAVEEVPLDTSAAADLTAEFDASEVPLGATIENEDAPTDIPVESTEAPKAPEKGAKQWFSPFRRGNRTRTAKATQKPGINEPQLFSKLDSKHQRDIKALELENKRLADIKAIQDAEKANNIAEDEKRLAESASRLEQLKVKAEEARLEAEGPKKEPKKVPAALVEKNRLPESKIGTSKETPTGTIDKPKSAVKPKPNDAAKPKPKFEKKKSSDGHKLFGLFSVSTISNKNPDGTPMTAEQLLEEKEKKHKSKLDALKARADEDIKRIQTAYDNQINTLKAEIGKIEERIHSHEENINESMTTAQAKFDDETKELDEKHEEANKNISDETEAKIKENLENIEQAKKDQEEAAEHLKELEAKQVESSDKLKVFEQDIQALKAEILNEKEAQDDVNAEKESKLAEIEELKKKREDYELKIKEEASKVEQSKQVISGYQENTHQKDIDDINENIEKLNKELTEVKQKSEESRNEREKLEAVFLEKQGGHQEELQNRAELDTLHKAAESAEKGSSQKLADLKAVEEPKVDAVEPKVDAVEPKAAGAPAEPASKAIDEGAEPPTEVEEPIETEETTAGTVSALASGNEDFKKTQDALLDKIETARKQREALAEQLKSLDSAAYESLPENVKV